MPDKIKNEIKESQIQWLSKRNECTDFQCIKDMYIRRIEYIRFRCFEHIPGKSGCISYSDAIERIDKEEYTQTHKSSAEVVKDLFVKHASQVHQLGFNGNQLKYGVFIELGNYVKYCTLEEYLSLMFELPGFKSLEKLDYKDYVGFKIKISGQPYSGFIFREEGDEFYLVGLVSGNEIIEAVTVGDTRRLSSIFMSYANHVINNNNVKH